MKNAETIQINKFKNKMVRIKFLQYLIKDIKKLEIILL